MTQNLLSVQYIDRAEVSNRLESFKINFNEFAYGIDVMDSLYNAAIDGKISSVISQQKYRIIRRIIALGSVVLVGAKSVIERLSIFHPEQMYYGYALIGLRVGSALLYGIDHYLKKSADNYLYQFLQQANPGNGSTMPDFPVLSVQSEAMKQLAELTSMVYETIDEEQLPNQSERNMFDRFANLMTHLFGSNPVKKVFTTGAKGLAFTLGSSAGISIAATGQDSEPSYQLTLISAIMDPVVETMLSALQEKNITRKYLQACEILYLCGYFLQNRGIEA
jgi:hypothetical protein